MSGLEEAASCQWHVEDIAGRFGRRELSGGFGNSRVHVWASDVDKAEVHIFGTYIGRYKGVGEGHRQNKLGWTVEGGKFRNWHGKGF